MAKPRKISPKPGQESVWDYPRPPRLEECIKHIRIVFDGEIIADTNRSWRVLETSHPPTYYLPKAAFKPNVLQASLGPSSFCEFKGKAMYYDIARGNKVAKRAAWGYSSPTARFLPLADTVSVYAHLMEDCFVNDERVQPQSGDFYGGWITKDIVGPFKGAPGTWGW